MSDQESATNEIVRNVDVAARATSGVHDDIARLCESADQVETDARDMVVVADELLAKSNTLRSEAREFYQQTADDGLTARRNPTGTSR